MFFKSFLRCVICFLLVQQSLADDAPNVNIAQSVSVDSTSPIKSDKKWPISGEYVTIIDKSASDYGQSSKEFPPSARHGSLQDTDYLEIDYAFGYDYGIIPAVAPELPECILSRSEFYLSWWVNEDGSLKLPASNRNGNLNGIIDLSVKFHSEDMIFKTVSDLTTNNPNDVIIFMSIANNELSHLPGGTLNLVSVSLQYLSLANNNFYYLFEDHDDTFQSWSAFPVMSNLKELDLRNCSLSRLEDDMFKSLRNLEKLFLSHNKFIEVNSIVFANLNHLQHLDLSYNYVEEIMFHKVDPYSINDQGLLLEGTVFNNLSNLIFLDLSHTKLKHESVRALAGLREKVEQLSLCYTELPMIVARMFSQTNLKVLDLSGNPNLTPNIQQSWFGGLEQKLEILVFRNSAIKNIQPYRNLMKLRMFDFENNNINAIDKIHINNLADLEILNLQSNHISPWYEPIFENHNRLKIVNLRSNNVNLITPVMMKDFSEVKFLAIGSNNFHCDCLLREFIERAALNAIKYQCGLSSRNRRVRRSSLPELEFFDPIYHYNVFLREFHNYVRYVDESYKNIIGGDNDAISFFQESKLTMSNSMVEAPSNCDSLPQTVDNNSRMNFDFLLLDYSENDYHCVESDGTIKNKVLFSEIAMCDSYSQSTDGSEIDLDDGEREDTPKFVGNKSSPNVLLIIYISIGIPLTALIAVVLWKRRDIRYFCAIFRNTLILSFDKDDKKALMMKNKRKSNNGNDDYRFDLFVSYSEKDRGFVLDQLIPNLEKRSEITICLHERDFQVGMSILENIIQCMDQSRCLLLVISESFLKSNWCSFEMHLAQHRLIETRREQLILVLLQDIPKIKRPRTLTYLMRTKTYIMWPSEDKEELRNNFWKRLKKAIVLNNWDPERSVTKPRHSIV